MEKQMDYAVESAEKIEIPQGADAMFELGLMYCLGRGVEPNLVIAHKWFNLAASYGCEAAKDYRAELVLEMSQQEIAEAQREARLWKSQADMERACA